MRALHKLVSAAVLCGFPLSLATGCAPQGGGTLPSALSGAPPAAARLGQAASKSAQWLQFGYDEGHSGYNPLETIVGKRNVSKLTIAWNDQKLIQPGGIVVDGGVAYVEDMGQTAEGLYAFDATSGKKKWHTKMNLNGNWGVAHAVPVVAGNLIVSPCSNGSSTQFLTGLCGVDAKTGKVAWRTYCTLYQGQGCEGMVNGTSPALYQNRVYFQATQGVNEQPDTMALNPQNGAVVWSVPGVYHCPDAGLSNNAPLPIADGLVFAVLGCQGQNGTTEICGISTATGHQAWCDQTADVYVDDVIAYDSRVYLAEAAGPDILVLALDAKTGGQVWAAKTPGANGAILAADGDRVFVGAGATALVALSAANGRKRWENTTNGNLFAGGVLSVANGILYADGGGGNNGNVALAAFDETNGNIVWTSGSIGNGGAPATPVVVNGMVYAGCYTLCGFKIPSAHGTRGR